MWLCGKAIGAGDVDLLVRAMGKLHHAMMGTAAVAIGTAAAISGTLVNLAAAALNAMPCASGIRPERCGLVLKPVWKTASGSSKSHHEP